MRHLLKPECELNHASLSQILGVIKPKAKRTLLEREILGRSDCTVINAVESNKYVCQVLYIGNFSEGHGRLPINLVG